MRNRGVMLLVMLAGACTAAGPASRANDDEAVRRVVDRWIDHLQTGRYDSLPQLLSPQFRFIMEGKRYSTSELMGMLRSFNATELHVYLDSVATRVRGDMAYLVYSDSETLKAGGVAATAHETGTIIAERDDGVWRLSQWTVTSPPPPAPAASDTARKRKSPASIRVLPNMRCS